MSNAQAYFIGSRNKVLIKTRKQETRKQESQEEGNPGSRKQQSLRRKSRTAGRKEAGSRWPNSCAGIPKGFPPIFLARVLEVLVGMPARETPT